MHHTRMIKIIFLICVLFVISSPHSVKGLGLVQWAEVPPNFQFTPTTLNGTNQSVLGGSGRIVIRQLLSLTLTEKWVVTVQAPPLKQVGGSREIVHSLKLNNPISSDNGVSIVGGPWYIDPSPVTIIRGQTSIGLLTNYAVNFGSNAFTLNLDPGLKLLNPGQSSTQYTTTITWTLTNPI